MGDLQRGVAHLAGLLPEDGPEEPLFWGQLGLTLRGDLADEDVAGADLGADTHDPFVVEVFEDVLGEVRDVSSDLLGAELGVSSVDLVLFDVDGGEHVVAYQALGDDDGVLEVVTLPRHEGDEQVLAEGELTVVGRWTVGEHVVLFDDVTGRNERLLVDAGALVRPPELEQVVRDPAAAGPRVVFHGDRVAGDVEDSAVALGEDEVASVAGGALFDPCPDVRGRGAQHGYGLALHVGAHQRPVGVVMLEEWDQRGRDRDDLLR